MGNILSVAAPRDVLQTIFVRNSVKNFYIIIFFLRSWNPFEMTCETYPVYKACNFLAINYYDEISNTFEDYLTEALICENTFLESENSNTLGSVDKLYRSPWQKIQCDEKFLSDEATKTEESVSEIGVNASLNLDESSWLFNNDDGFHDDNISEKEANIFDEKDLEIFKENTLDGKFQLLDVPYLPFNLSSVAFKRPLLTDLLIKLPIMEVEDVFEVDSNFPFEDIETFFDTDLEDTGEKLSQSSTEKAFKEIPLPELPNEEYNFLDIANINKNTRTMPGSMKFNQGQGSCLNDMTSNDLLLQSQKSFLPIHSDCTGDYKSKYNKGEVENNFENNIQREADDEVFTFHLEENSVAGCTLNSKNIEGNTYVVDNTFNGSETNINSNKSLRNSSTLEHSNANDAVPNFCFDSFNSESDVNELITKITAPSQTNEGTRGYDAYSFLNHSSEFHANCHNFDDTNETDSCSQNNNFTVEEFLPEPQFEENNDFVDKKSSVIDDNEKNSYIEKISKITFEKKINEKNETTSSSVLPNNGPSKIFKSCTAIRNDRIPNSQFSSLCSNNLSEDQQLSQNSNSSKTVNLLSNFLNITKLSNNNFTSTSKSKCNFLKSYLKGKENEDSTSNQKSFFSEVLSSSKNKSPPATVPEFKVEDLLVKLPDEMIKIVHIYEANAVPLLLSLLQSDQFKFPLKFTIADISPCKTCFLLNQEVKQCRDNNTSLLKERGQRQDYYSQLLAFHGLLKSLECFIHFDVQLAVTNLLEFEERHIALLKGFYDSFIKTFKTETNKCAEINYIHPKLRELSKFLKEKFSLCKETGQIFKVMIIIKKYLNVVYKKFESVLKEEMCNIKTFLIPESVFLHENTLMFKSSEDTVYFVSPSSLAKNIPWKDMILTIEFQHDNNSCWKHICSEKNISHAFVQVTDLPLKSLDEIQKLKPPDKASISSVQSTVKSLVVSGSVISQYQLLYLLESRLDLSICIRQYKEILPHLHFADVAVDEKSALILVSSVSFSEDEFPEILFQRVSFLLLKYEVCWIIVQEYKESLITLKQMKSNENFWKYFVLTEDLFQKSLTHKVKMLHAHSIEETLDLIRSILLRSLNNHPISVASQISKEEVFLMSFPSLNPYIVQHMISECSLYEIMNLTLEELLQKWSFIPERFLKCFHSTVHKVLSSESDTSDESPESTPDSDHELNSENNQEFKLKPNYHKNLNEFPDFDDSEEATDSESFLDSEFANIVQDDDHQHLCVSKKANDQSTSDKSLQELDLDYMSLKLSHEYDGYNDYLNEDGASIFSGTGYSMNKCAVVSPRKKCLEDDYSYNFESLNSQISDRKRNSHCDRSLMRPKDRLELLETSNMVTVGRETFPSSVSKIHNPQNGNNSMLDLEKFIYIPKKRTLLTEDLSPNNDCLSSPALKKSCRIQKGMISKIVSKTDLVYPSSFSSQDVASCDSGNVRKAKVSPFMKRGHYFEKNDKKTAVESKSGNDTDIYFEHRQSQWPDSSLPLKSLPMTPATRKLGYEKMPGVKGQTRLVFQ
ncbi:hypothetical protein AVEN_26020-1 [Araneus ventricosus]|uniref:Protein shortage in chiasmata 1 ortholog n=1 Tax=Araneus ventricosus TaxID=182803 RepID=A0A4Y2E5Z9_ARAVE|nr:hypothetical protein AVEN_26020-1 [Araneus ventricosus]